ncbi:MAG: phosphoribosyl-AMP cyclohydrolase [Acetobacteraceae bacterium]
MPAELPASLRAALRFDRSSLIPAIAQDHASGEVLMLAWMNAESIAATLASGFATYWSRSRKTLWRKGETSGHTQRLVEFRLDCDGDAILLRVEQAGPACHTGHRACFFRAMRDGALVETG